MVIRRLKEAAETGCSFVHGEVNDIAPGSSNHSLNNFVRLGFNRTYDNESFAFLAGPLVRVSLRDSPTSAARTHVRGMSASWLDTQRPSLPASRLEPRDRGDLGGTRFAAEWRGAWEHLVSMRHCSTRLPKRHRQPYR